MISHPLSRVQYVLTSATQAVSIPFYFLLNSHVRVIRTRNDTDVTLVSGYTLLGQGNENGGTCTFTGTQTAIGDRITIRRNAPQTQETEYVANDRFPHTSHETALDKLTMLIQQQAEVTGRAIVFGETEVSPSVVIPFSTRKNKLMGFDGVGAMSFSNPVSLIATNGTVVEASSYSAIRAMNVAGFVTGKQVRGTGYSSAGDGGDGIWYWDADSVEDDDNGTVLKVTTVTTGRFKRHFTAILFPEMFGAKGDGTTLDTVALNAAIGCGKGVVQLTPGKTYLVDLRYYSEADPAYPQWYAIKLVSGMKLIGNHAKIKLADDECTVAVPKYYDLIASNAATAFKDIIVEGVVFDMNGDNNQFGTLTYTNNTAALIAKYPGCSVENFIFRFNYVLNTAGATCVGIGNNVDAVNGKNVWIYGNHFSNVGIYTSDHSSIFTQADDVWIYDNHLKRTAYPSNTESVSGIECHGSRHYVRNNTVLLFRTGIIIGNSPDYPVTECYVTDNVIYAERWGVVVDKPNDTHTMDKIIIDHNVINLADTDHGDIEPKAGVHCKLQASALEISVTRNHFYAAGNTNRSKFALWAGNANAGDFISRLNFNGNVVHENYNFGVYAQNTVGTMGSISINDNEFDGLVANAQYTSPYAVFVVAAANLPITSVTLNGNRFRNLGAGVLNAFVSGNATGGAIGYLSATGNVYSNTPNTGLSIDVVTNSKGSDALTMAAIPTYGTWAAGDRLTAIGTSESLSTGRVLVGWYRITSGSGNVAGTDWAEITVATKAATLVSTSVESGAAVAVPTGTSPNIASIALGIGVWDVSAMLYFVGTPTVNNLACSVSGTSATMAFAAGYFAQTPAAPTVNSELSLAIAPIRITLAAPLTFYLVASSSLAAGTVTAYGNISAKRVA